MEKDRDGIVSIEDLKTLLSLQIERFGCMFESQVNEDDDDINFHQSPVCGYRKRLPL